MGSGKKRSSISAPLATDPAWFKDHTDIPVDKLRDYLHQLISNYGVPVWRDMTHQEHHEHFKVHLLLMHYRNGKSFIFHCFFPFDSNFPNCKYVQACEHCRPLGARPWWLALFVWVTSPQTQRSFHSLPVSKGINREK